MKVTDELFRSAANRWVQIQIRGMKYIKHYMRYADKKTLDELSESILNAQAEIQKEYARREK